MAKKVIKKVNYILAMPLGGSKIGDIVSVKMGYGRYLERTNKAIRASEANIGNIETYKASWLVKEKENEKAAKILFDKLKGIEGNLIIKKRIAQGEKLYESVRFEDVLNCLKSKGIVLKKENIKMRNIIKTLGVHEITIHLYADYSMNRNVEIVPEDA